IGKRFVGRGVRERQEDDLVAVPGALDDLGRFIGDQELPLVLREHTGEARDVPLVPVPVSDVELSECVDGHGVSSLLWREPALGSRSRRVSWPDPTSRPNRSTIAFKNRKVTSSSTCEKPSVISASTFRKTGRASACTRSPLRERNK